MSLRNTKGGPIMARLWLVVLLVAGAIFIQYTPAAFAGCEGNASSSGNHAIAFCNEVSSERSGGRCGGAREIGNRPAHFSR